MWPILYLPKGELRFEKRDYRTASLAAWIEELRRGNFNGCLEILAPHEHGLLIFQNGSLFSCFQEGSRELSGPRETVLRHFLETEPQTHETLVRAVALDSRFLEALSALDNQNPMQRELETSFLDMGKLFETLIRKHFTGTLRFYTVRNHTRLGNILIKMGKINQDQLKEAIRLQLAGEGGLRLGDALVKTGAISFNDLREALSRQSQTRKGSRTELALACFWQGEWLGGYTFAQRQLVLETAVILQWLNQPDVLMDMMEGRLPAAMDFPFLPAPQSVPSVKSAEPIPDTAGREVKADQVLRDLADDTFRLKADDLILDLESAGTLIHEPLKTEAAEPEGLAEGEAADRPDEPESGPEPVSETLHPEPVREIPVPQPAEEDAWAFLSRVAEKHLGFFGNPLLFREKRNLKFSAPHLAEEEFYRQLQERFLQKVSETFGATLAEKVKRDFGPATPPIPA